MRKIESPFASVLILADSDALAAVDKSALRGRGIRHVRFMTSGKEAARLLARQHSGRDRSAPPDAAPAVDLVICNATLTDMQGTEFLRLIRTHPRLAGLPVIIASASATRSDVVEAVSAGCSGFLLRPYTVDAFAEQFELAARALRDTALRTTLAAGQNHLATEAFDAALESFGKVVLTAQPRCERLYDEGMTLLAEHDYTGAIHAFNKAVRLNVLYAEAYVGLSRAWRGKGDTHKAQKFMRLAGEAYARLERFAEARAVYQSLVKERPDLGNPLTGTATSLLRQGNYTAAAKALAESRRLSPDTDINTQVARACHFTDRPERAAKGLCLALERQGEQELAEKLYKRLLDAPTHDTASQRPAISRFPRVQELLGVIRYTLRMYRQADQTS